MHEHPEGQSNQEFDAQHEGLPSYDSYDQGPEANRAMDDGPPGDDDLTAKGKPSDGQVAQTGFGDHIVNTEDEEGVQFLSLLDERATIKAAASRFNEVNADIKKQLTNRGLYSGNALRIRVGAHILNLSDLSEDKDVEAKTRVGSQGLGIVHPD